MAIKDFSVLLEPVQTAYNKKDISLVTGYNAISQYIESIMKTQKGELISNMSLGTDYFTYIFGSNNTGVMEFNLASYLEAAIPQIRNVKVKLTYYTVSKMEFEVTFSLYDGIKNQNNLSCFIEVTP